MAKNNKKVKLILISILFLASLLRFWRLGRVPVSLFGDELDVGYQAYSILKTGKDYTGNPWPLHFQSLAEWRTPIFLYSVVPTVAIFGISPLGVRLPAAFFGVLGVWGIYLLVEELIKDKKVKKESFLPLLSAFVLAISPWHIQYSRAAFEVTELLAFLIFGLYFFFYALRRGKYLWLSGILIALTPLIYSTAKLFSLVLLVFLFLFWKKEILKLPKKSLFSALLVVFLVGLLVVLGILFSGGAQRFSYISVFSDPTRETDIGYERELDARVRGKIELGLQPSITDKIFHNKLVFWGEKISNNYLQALSTEFLFTQGDPNLRHSIQGMGQFYLVESVALVLGLILFYGSKENKKIKVLMTFWLLAGILPSSLTRDGGNHATRLILILPPLVFLISYGLISVLTVLKGLAKVMFFSFYFLILLFSFIFYQHNFWVHNPWYSERWWHSGWCEAVNIIKEIDDRYDKVIISMKDEPAWIFFAACYQYPPLKWQEENPLENVVFILCLILLMKRLYI